MAVVKDQKPQPLALLPTPASRAMIILDLPLLSVTALGLAGADLPVLARDCDTGKVDSYNLGPLRDEAERTGTLRNACQKD